MSRSESRIIVALDFPAEEPALQLVEQLTPERCRLKVGKEMFTRLGPGFVRELSGRGFDVFLDLKFHDIPNTVAAACRAAADLGVWMINVHASGGPRMMEAAREVLAQQPERPLLIGVTILTSLAQADLEAIGYAGSPQDNVLRLARLAEAAGLDGVVCSPQETQALRAAVQPGFRLVTPGVRPLWAATGDQKRVATPADALRNGADYLVIGRPVTAAADPLEKLDLIQQELAAVP